MMPRDPENVEDLLDVERRSALSETYAQLVALATTAGGILRRLPATEQSSAIGALLVAVQRGRLAKPIASRFIAVLLERPL
jgi:hypothetical protein